MNRIATICLLALALLLPQHIFAQSVGSGVNVVNLNDWGSGFNVTFEYEITADDVADDRVRDWRIEIDYTGAGTISNPYMTGYSGSILSGYIAPDGGFAITNEGVGYRPELDEGYKLTFTLQGQGTSFDPSDIAIEFVNLTELPTNEFVASLVSVNDWYNPSWGGGFNATFRCDVLGPDAQIGPVTDLLIDFNYSGSGTPSSAWTQSHNGPIEYGFIAPDGGYAISNLGGFQPELYAGDSITFAIQVQGAGFDEADFDIQCGSGGSTTTTTNTAPVAANESLSIESGQPLDVVLTAIDSEGDSLSYDIVQPPSNGVLNGSAPNLVYTSDVDFVGSDQFSYSVSDGELESTGTISITVEAVQSPLEALSETITVDEDVAVELSLGYTGGNGSTVTYDIISGPDYGVLSGTAPDLTFTPNADYFGTDAFTFQVSDSENVSNIVTVEFTVNAVNDAPTAIAQVVDTDESVPVSIVLVGDDIDGDALSYSVIEQPTHGTLEGAAPEFTYIPTPGYSGSDYFTYTVSDGVANSEPVGVTVSIALVNQAPMAFSQSVNTEEDSSLALQLTATDNDADPLTYQISEQPTNGSLEGTPPALVYTPNPNFSGTDSFVFVVNDGNVDSGAATVFIVVSDVDDSPIVESPTVLVDEDASLDILLSATDSDTTDLVFEIVNGPANGELSGVAPVLSYMPNDNFYGTDSFSFTVSDGTNPAVVGEVTIQISPINDAPVMDAAELSVDSGVSVSYVPSAIDIDSEILTYIVVDGPNNGTIDTSSNEWVYTSTANFVGTDSIVVKANDGELDSDTVTIEIEVLAVEPDVVPAQTYLGKEFWLSFSFNDLPGDDETFDIIISSVEGTTGTVEIPLLGTTETFTVPSNGTYTLSYDNSRDAELRIENLAEIQQRGIYIKTENDAAVYALNNGPYSTDGFLVLPLPVLGTEYVVTAFGTEKRPVWARNTSYFSILATEDDTTVTFIPDYDVFNYVSTFAQNYLVAFEPVEITLNRGETYTNQNGGNWYVNDPTGTKISSDKPIAVQGGSGCTAVPYNRFPACDHLVEQTPPFSVWGTKYVSAPLATRSKGDFYRVYGAFADTQITINGVLVANLEDGEFYETLIEGPSVFESNKPIQVAQLATGASFGGSTLGQDFADPLMLLLPAAENFLNEYVVAIPTEQIQYSFVNIIVSAAGRDTILHNDELLSADIFEPIENTDFYYTQLAVEGETERFKSTHNFGLSIYGFDLFDTYGFIGGSAFGNSGEAARIGLEINLADSIDADTCLGISVFDDNDQRLAASQVQIRVSGNTSLEKYILTNELGLGEFCYSAFEPGVDTVEVIAGGVQSTISVTWSPSTLANRAPEFTSVPNLKAFEWEAYQYTPEVIDTDGDNITFELIESPDGMVIDTATGRIQWDVPVDGFHPVIIAALDGTNPRVNQEFNLRAFDEYKTDPYFTSEPNKFIISYKNQLSYSYDPTYSQPSMQYRNRYFVAEGPSAMRFPHLSSGLYTWRPTADDVGEHNIVLGVSDYWGGLGYQEYTLTVTDSEPPYFDTTSTTLEVYPGEPLDTYIVATDPDGDDVSYVFTTFNFDRDVEPPEGIAMEEATGRFTAVFGENDSPGSKAVYVRAKDGNGGSARHTVYVYFKTRPVVVSTPVTTGTPETEYRYQVTATDVELTTIRSYTLEQGPDGMTIDEDTGQISWTPTASQIGVFNVIVKIENSRAGVAYHEFSITIQGTVGNPPTLADFPNLSIVAGETLSLQAQATDDDGDAVTYGLVAAPAGMLIDAVTGELSWPTSATDIGQYVIEVSATDGSNLVSKQFQLEVTEDTFAPVIEITSPEHLSTVTNIVSIVGSITDSDLASWRVIVQRNGQTDFTELATGTTEVVDDVLGEFDPTLMINGQYTIAVIATDTAGNETIDGVVVIVDGDLKVGNFSVTFNDLSIPMLGIPININRTYDTRRKSEDLDFGYGWTIDYQDVEITESRELGKGWEFNEYTSGVIFGEAPDFCVEPLGEPTVVVRLPDDSIQEFTVEYEEPCHPIAILDGRLAFKPKNGTTAELKAVNDSLGRFDPSTGNIVKLGGDALDPRTYELTTKAGFVYTIDQSFGIRTVSDPLGNSLTYSDDGITHSAGKSIEFVRNAEGRITEITDPAGNIISYSYNADRDLESMTDRAFATTEYTYIDQHALYEILDPLGRRIMRNIYSDDGRLIAQEDSAGNRTEYSYDLEGRQSTMLDRLGRALVLTYDQRGNVLNKVDALGGLYEYSYDEFDNQVSMTNPLGFTSFSTYDNEYNLLTYTNQLGNTHTYTHNRRGQEISYTDARGNVHEFEYSFNGDPISTTDPFGAKVSLTTDERGLVREKIGTEGQKTSYEYDQSGNKIKEVDAEGGIRQFSYDQNNNLLSESLTRTQNGEANVEVTRYEYNSRDQLIRTIDAQGNVASMEYDLLGRVTGIVDELGRRTTKTYNIYGQLVSSTYPDSSTKLATYDLVGNMLSSTDRLGRLTTYKYDLLDRLVETQYPDGAVAQKSYDAVGNILVETDGRGAVTTHSYDSANHRISTVDALGGTILFEYDVDGNLISETDSRGFKTSYAIDALDRVVDTTYPDGTIESSLYDNRGLTLAQTDENGRVTRFQYDGLSQLVEVEDALGNTTAYAYDERGNKISKVDALGRITQWSYDSLGRQTSHTLPMGQVSYHEYDEVGNVTSFTDFKGDEHTFTYDSFNDWLVSEQWADGSFVSYEYDAIGNRILASDSNGTIRTLYDQRDRISKETKHDGTEISYDYDESGNRIELTIKQDGVTQSSTYAYDHLNRLSSFTDFTGNVTEYEYDLNGNQITVEYSNGTRMLADFDSRNRSTSIQHIDGGGAIMRSILYEYDGSGKRQSITESNGRLTNYSYDGLYRLTEETILDLEAGNFQATYSYDSVGNRIAEVVNGIQVVISYDENDRLVERGIDQYTYDDNGNTIEAAVGGRVDAYSFDSQNRLASVESAGTLEAFEYDPSGNRISSSVDGIATSYLVDSNRDHAQVLRKISSGQQTTYNHGNELTSLISDNSSYTFHIDALGSTRLLTNQGGQVVDDVRYNAWGEILYGGLVGENEYYFTGEQQDLNSGKLYLRARYLDTSLGRFISTDPWVGNDLYPSTLNDYAYVLNDPVNLFDYSGLYPTMGQVLSGLDGYSALQKAAYPSFRVTLKKISKEITCYAIEEAVTTGIEMAVTHGTYALAFDGGDVYSGQSKQMDAREKQHERYKFKNQAFRTAARFEVVRQVGDVIEFGGKDDRRLIEQLMMDYYDDDADISTRNNAKSIADKPRSDRSQKLRKLLDKIEVCK